MGIGERAKKEEFPFSDLLKITSFQVSCGTGDQI